MLQEVKEKLEKILANGPDGLLDSDVAFLRARRGYLNDEQISRFAKHFRGLPKTEKKEDKNEVIEQPETASPEVVEEVKKVNEVNSIVDTPSETHTIADDADKYDPDYQG